MLLLFRDNKYQIHDNHPPTLATMGMIIRYFSIKKVKLFNRVADPRPFQVGLLFKYRCQIRFRLSGPAAKVKQIKSRSWPKKLQSAVKKQSTILVLKNDKEKRKLIKVCFAAGSGDDRNGPDPQQWF